MRSGEHRQSASHAHLAMTDASRMGPSDMEPRRRKSAPFHGVGPRARNLLGLPRVGLLPLALVAALALGAAACVVPLPYEEAPDGAVNYPPLIKDSNPSMPGPVRLAIGAEPPLFTIDVEDKDLGDTLFVRVFRDYSTAPEPPRNDLPRANDPNSGSSLRTIELQTNTWCTNAVPNVNLVFDVVVADRPFLEDLSIKPVYRAVPKGAESSIRSWVIECLQ